MRKVVTFNGENCIESSKLVKKSLLNIIYKLLINQIAKEISWFDDW